MLTPNLSLGGLSPIQFFINRVKIAHFKKLRDVLEENKYDPSNPNCPAISRKELQAIYEHVPADITLDRLTEILFHYGVTAFALDSDGSVDLVKIWYDMQRLPELRVGG